MKLFHKILLASLIVWANVLTVKAGIIIGFPSDTVYACIGEIYSITPSVAGGTEPYDYQWSNGDTTSFLEIVPIDSIQMYHLIVSDLNGDTAIKTITVLGLPECVWPGDANGDGVADNRDVLTLGLTYGEIGLLRPDAHTNWIGQAAPAWMQSFTSGLNFVHADTDGNGIVEMNDFSAIELNYLSPTNSNDTVSGSQGVPLYIDFPTTSYQLGDTIKISVYLGTDQIPADSIYGIAFSINYDQGLIDSGSVHVDYSGSWLGNYGADLAAVDKDFYNDGQIDIGITRIDHLTVNGYGLVADITVMIDDITGKKDFEEIIIELGNVSLIDVAGKNLPVTSSSGKINVTLSNQDLDFPENEEMTVYPNPTDGIITVEVQPSFSSRSSNLVIRDLQGRLIREIKTDFQYQLDVDLSNLPGGVYLAEWSNNITKIVKKFAIK